MDDPIYQAFFDYCKYQKGLSENTIRSYFFDLRTYDAFLADNGIMLRKVRTKQLDEFINYLGKALNNSKRTVARKIEALKAFYKYLYRIDEIEVDVMKKIDSPKLSRSLPKYLTFEQQDRLLDYFDSRPERQAVTKWIKKRDKAIAIVFLDTGVRVSELCNIKINDLNFTGRFMKVTGKGGKEDEVFLSDRAIETLEDYIDNARSHLLRKGTIWKRGKRFCVYRYIKGEGIKCLKSCVSKEEAEKVLYEVEADQGYLFVRRGIKKMSTRHIYRILYLAGKALGFHVHPHRLRHTFASNLRTRGADLLLIKEALRHEDVSTTQIYAHISRVRYHMAMGKYLNDNEQNHPSDPIQKIDSRTKLKLITQGKKV